MRILEEAEEGLKEAASRLENSEDASNSTAEPEESLPRTDRKSGNSRLMSRRKAMGSIATTAAILAGCGTNPTDGDQEPRENQTSTRKETDLPKSTEKSSHTQKPTESPTPSETTSPSPQPTESPTPTDTPTATPTATPTPTDYPDMSEAGQRMYETAQYHPMLDDLDTLGSSFMIFDWVNQRKGTPEDKIEKQAPQYWAQDADLFDWKDAETEVYGLVQGVITKLEDSVDPDEIYQNFLDRGYSESGEKINGITILESEDNLANGRKGEEKPAAAAIDRDTNTVLYSGSYTAGAADSQEEAIGKVKAGLNAKKNRRSILDTKMKDGEEYKGQLHPLQKEKAADKGSPFYVKDIVDFTVDNIYSHLNGYKANDVGANGLDVDAANYVIGALLQEDDPTEEVDMYRTKFSNENGVEQHSILGEYSAATFHSKWSPHIRNDIPEYEEDNPDHAAFPFAAAGAGGYKASQSEGPTTVLDLMQGNPSPVEAAESIGNEVKMRGRNIRDSLDEAYQVLT